MKRITSSSKLVRNAAPQKTGIGGILRKDRRRNKSDRRSSVREGIFISLSTRPERRKGGDRRKRNTRPIQS